MPYNHFKTSPIPNDVQPYKKYRRLSIAFAEVRHHTSDHLAPDGHDLPRVNGSGLALTGWVQTSIGLMPASTIRARLKAKFTHHAPWVLDYHGGTLTPPSGPPQALVEALER